MMQTAKIGRWLLAVVAALLCPPGSVRAADLTLGIAVSTESMDPHYHQLASNMAVLSHVFEMLVAQDRDMKLVPGLATSWRVVDPTTWEFKLRPQVKFHDGSDFTADDVLFSFKRVPLVPNSPSSYATFLRGIASTEVVDPLTIRFHTKGPYPDIAVDLSLVSILSHVAGAGPAAEGKTTQQMNAGDGTVGTGPYRFVSFRPGERVVFARNDAYWGDKEPWQTVTEVVIPSAPSRVAALLSGQVDAIEKVLGEDMVSLRANPNFSTFAAPSNSVTYLVIDQYRDQSPGVTSPDGKNPLKDVRVRKALSLALNRDALSQQVMSGMSTPAAELVAPGMFGAMPGVNVEKYDPVQAKQLLAEAGYGDGFGLKLVTSNGLYVQDAQMAQAIAAMWTRIGVRTTVDAVPGSMYYARRAAQELSVFYTSSSMMTGQATDMLKVLLATRDAAKGMGQINFGGYSNPRVDSLLDEAGHTLDTNVRQHLLEQASHIAIAEDYAALPIHIEKLGYAVRKPLNYTPRLDKGFTAMQIRGE